MSALKDKVSRFSKEYNIFYDIFETSKDGTKCAERHVLLLLPIIIMISSYSD
jgi:hypothetical protein